MIKYRTTNQTPADFIPQKFSNLKPVYRLNKATNELELTDEVIDIQELVNSCKEVALNAILDRFLPQIATSDEIVTVNRMQDDLDTMCEAINLAESYRQKYNLSDKLTYTEIFDTIYNKSVELKEKVDKSQKILEDLENEKKKENDEESK